MLVVRVLMHLEAHNQLPVTLNHLIAHLFAKVRINAVKGLDDLFIVRQHWLSAIETKPPYSLNGRCFLV